MSCSASSAVMVLAMGGGGDRGDEPPLPPIDATAKFGPTPVCSHISRQTQTRSKAPPLYRYGCACFGPFGTNFCTTYRSSNIYPHKACLSLRHFDLNSCFCEYLIWLKVSKINVIRRAV